MASPQGRGLQEEGAARVEELEGGTGTRGLRMGAGPWLALTPLSMVCVWHRVPSAAGMLLVMHRLLLLRHHSSLQTSCGPRRPLKLALLLWEDPGDALTAHSAWEPQ